jgi:hypothetical protein
MAFHVLPQKACKEAPKPKCDKDDDDKDSRPVKWHHKHPAEKKSSGDCG